MKKKKKKKAAEATSENAGAGEAEISVEDLVDFSQMEKKEKKKKPEADEKEEGEDVFCSTTGGEEPWLNSSRDYTYQEMLQRVFEILRQNNPELAGDKKKQSVVPPIVHREGTKKTAFSNISDMCKRMHRTPEHLIQFLFAELGTTGSVDANERLVIKGRFQQKQIESVVRRYIMEYVTCKTCKSLETQLSKENRLYFIKCDSCGSTRSVSAIKTGFKAQTEKRARTKAVA